MALLHEIWKPASLMVGLGLSLASLPEKPKKDKRIKPMHGIIPFWADGSDYVCERASGPISIDGNLDKPDWQRAEKIVLVTTPGGKETQTLTVAKLLYDDEYLYFCAELEDHDLVGTAQGHDSEWGEGENDVVELFIKPETTEPGYWPHGAYWEFHAMPQGATRDYLYAKKGYPETIAVLAESGMKTAIIMHGTLNNWMEYDEGYTVEMAIPLAAFKTLAPSPKPGDRWRFLVARYDYSVHIEGCLETSASADLPTLDFHKTECYPYLVFGE